MKTKIILILVLCFMLFNCAKKDNSTADKKVWAWLAGSAKMTDTEWDNYFSKAKYVGIDAIILQVHGGYPIVDSTEKSFVDTEAIQILKTAVPYAKKYGIELHAWMWTINRCEKNLRAAHPDWYQVSAEGKSCLDVKLYNREHYRWLCPSRSETLDYLKERVAELAKLTVLQAFISILFAIQMPCCHTDCTNREVLCKIKFIRSGIIAIAAFVAKNLNNKLALTR